MMYVALAAVVAADFFQPLAPGSSARSRLPVAAPTMWTYRVPVDPRAYTQPRAREFAPPQTSLAWLVFGAATAAGFASARVAAAAVMPKEAPISESGTPQDEDIWMTPAMAAEIQRTVGTPCFAYSEELLVKHAKQCLSFPNNYGLTVRYAMKSASNRRILQTLDSLGVHIDASSGYEVERAIEAGIDPTHISLSAQRLPGNDELRRLVAKGVKVNACSLQQIEKLAAAKASRIGLRFNPGVGSGGTNKTNVGGPSSSFGIWHELLEEADAIARRCGLTVECIHTHIGSGSDPEVWSRASKLTLDLARRFPDVTRVDLGGGFKVRRTGEEVTTNLSKIGLPVAKLFADFELETGRRLHLEIEPGTYLVARAGTLVASVADVVNTGESGYKFIKLDAGMTEILRPSLYAAQHPIAIYPQSERETVDQVIVGHCCESGDLLTPLPSDAGELLPRPLPEAREGDIVAIGGAGAYCSTMAATNYNSFPMAAEVLVGADGAMEVVRSRQIGNDVPAFETVGQVRFHKFHGLGNDFLVVDERWTSTTRPELAAAAKALCDRNRGIGADGVLVLLKPESAEHDVRLRIYNSDGSEPEMCGNGVRCAALYFHQFGEGPAQMTVDTYAGTIECDVDGSTVRVGMGPPRVEAADVPTTLEPGLPKTIEVAGEKVEVCAMGMGNPHCIVICESPERLAALEKIAPQIEVAAEFPEKTNVELTVVESRSRVNVTVWERGAGWTQACGTGACATVVATAMMGLTERKATVVLPGGELDIDWGEEQVFMTGPAEYVCSGTARI